MFVIINAFNAFWCTAWASLSARFRVKSVGLCVCVCGCFVLLHCSLSNPYSWLEIWTYSAQLKLQQNLGERISFDGQVGSGRVDVDVKKLQSSTFKQVKYAWQMIYIYPRHLPTFTKRKKNSNLNQLCHKYMYILHSTFYTSSNLFSLKADIYLLISQ